MTIATIKDELEGMMHGTSLNKVQNLNGVFNRAARFLLADVDVDETIRVQQITNALYDSINDYVLADDLKEDAIIDIRPQVDRTKGDIFVQHGTAEFDQYKADGSFAIKHNSGVKTLRASKALTTGIVLNGCDSLTDNGTWAATADAQNLAVDSGALVRGGDDGPAIAKDSPAEKAGLLAEDIILEVNEKKIDENNPLLSLISEYNPGDTATLKINRGGKEVELKVVLGKRPQ